MVVGVYGIDNRIFDGSLQPILEFGVPLADRKVSHSVGKGIGLPDKHAYLLGTGDACINQVALQHNEMGHHNGHDHDGVFRALSLVYGGGVGKREFVEFCRLVFHHLPVKVHTDGAFFQIYRPDDSDVSVENVFLVVVPYLHNPVVRAVGVTATADARRSRVKRLLQKEVEVGGPYNATLHGCQHLDVAKGLFVGRRQAVFHEVDNLLRHSLRVVVLDEEEIRLLAVADVRESPLVDCVGIHDDTAGLRLAENPCKAYYGNAARIDDVTQHIARSNAWKLVDVAHKDEAHGQRHGLQQVIHQQDVDHRAFVHNKDIARERILLIVLVPVHRVILQKPVNRLGVHAGGFAHTLGGTPSRGSQQDLKPLRLKGGDDALRGGGLSRSRSTGQHHHLRLDGLTDGVGLDFVVLDPRNLLHGLRICLKKG